MRVALVLATIMVLVGIAVAVALVLFARSEGQGLVPDRIQETARPDPPDRAAPAAPAAPPAQCPAGVAGCRTVSGRILYVEAIDPDGDGDAHFVLAGTASVTGPGITVVDVRRDLRPNPLPGPGDHLSAAGPVATGSFGQSQIEAVAVGG